MRRMVALAKVLALLSVGLPVIAALALRRFIQGETARGFPPWFARLLCRIIGVRLVIEGPVPASGPALVTANHLSWLDIPVLAATTPLAFVSKQEVAGWPLFGFMARLHRTLFINRERRHSTGPSRADLQERLAAGEIMVLFPEGTSGDGTRLLPFKSSFFAAAVLGNVPVHPVTMAHVRFHGLPLLPRHRPVFAWYGDMDLMPHLWGVLQAGPLVVHLRFHPPLQPSDFPDRKALARRVQETLAEDLALILAGRR